jgi:hypothetical protein
MRFFDRSGVTLLLIVPIAAAMTGCGRDGPPRRIVVGSVTYAGKHVDDGQIRFTPTKGSTGPVSIAKITNGQYRADHHGGVPVATQQVQILGYRPDPQYKGQEKNRPPMFSPDEWPPKLQYLPEKYNAKTTLEFVVENGRGEVRKDFELAQ